MSPPLSGAMLFNETAWKPALEKFGAVTHLTVALYDRDAGVAVPPVHRTPLFELFERHGYHPGILLECARRCLAQSAQRPAVIVAPSCGLAVVGTSLVLEGSIVGAAVAGYALVDFSQASAIQVLAREARIPFHELWEVARTSQPLPRRRLALHGELLQVLGDAILRENHRTRLLVDATARLNATAAAKDEFLAMLSHELRNPLAAITPAVALLGRVGTPDKEAAQAVIGRQVRRMIRLIDDLLEISRLDAGKIDLDRGVVDLVQIARGALATLDQTGRTRRHDISLQGESACVEGDATRLEQIVENLLDNAVKYTPAGGKIVVSVERDGPHNLIRVKDNGIGVAPELLPRVFDVFVQADRSAPRSRGGLGLGLTLVRRLTELHGGSVSVTSAGQGLGSEFVVRLPHASDQTSNPEASPATDDAGRRTPAAVRRILLIEDNEDVRLMMRMALQLKGHEIHEAPDGVRGVEAAYLLRPDIALIDIGLPRLDGYTVAREIRASDEGRRIYLVALTGYGRPEDRQRAAEAGFDLHLTKPVDPGKLAEAVGSAPIGQSRNVPALARRGPRDDLYH